MSFRTCVMVEVLGVTIEGVTELGGCFMSHWHRGQTAKEPGWGRQGDNVGDEFSSPERL